MREFYKGINPRTGQRIYPGRLRGSDINPYGPLTIEAETQPNTSLPYYARYSRVGDPTQAGSFNCAADEDHDDNQPPAPKYLDDHHNYPIVPITPGDDQ